MVSLVSSLISPLLPISTEDGYKKQDDRKVIEIIIEIFVVVREIVHFDCHRMSGQKKECKLGRIGCTSV